VRRATPAVRRPVFERSSSFCSTYLTWDVSGGDGNLEEELSRARAENRSLDEPIRLSGEVFR
jgi:hypothetical protein